MNPNANTYVPKNTTPHHIMQHNMNEVLHKIGLLNQTLHLLGGELVKKDTIIRNMIVEYNMLKMSKSNEINELKSKISEMTKKIELLDDMNKSLLNNFKNKSKINETLMKQLTAANDELKQLKSKKIYNETNIRLLNQITLLEDTNRDFKKQIENMKKTLEEKEKHLNECIDTIFMYQMKYDKI